jgi:CRISPR-associated protein Cas1
LLNGVCHAAIVSGGYSPALGFVHTGKQLSFVYDTADLYKTETTIPAAFEAASKRKEKVEPLAREICRMKFREIRLLQRILPDIDALLGVEDDPVDPGSGDVDDDPVLPDPLWGPLLDGEG